MDQKSFNWSEEEYSLAEFLGKKQDRLPLVILVSQGHYDYKEGDTMPTGQILRVDSWVSQTRVLGKDKKGRHISIPIDYPVNFKVKKRKPKVKKKSIEWIVNNHTLPVLVKFDSKINWRLFIGDKKYNTSNYGKIQLDKTHIETYLRCNRIDKDGVSEKVCMIPVQFGISVRIAEGLSNKTREEWKKLQTQYSNSVKHVPFTQLRGRRDITIYDDISLIRTTAFTVSSENQANGMSSHSNSDNGEFIDPYDTVEFKQKSSKKMNGKRDTTLYDSVEGPNQVEGNELYASVDTSHRHNAKHTSSSNRSSRSSGKPPVPDKNNGSSSPSSRSSSSSSNEGKKKGSKGKNKSSVKKEEQRSNTIQVHQGVNSVHVISPQTQGTGAVSVSTYPKGQVQSMVYQTRHETYSQGPISPNGSLASQGSVPNHRQRSGDAGITILHTNNGRMITRNGNPHHNSQMSLVHPDENYGPLPSANVSRSTSFHDMARSQQYNSMNRIPVYQTLPNHMAPMRTVYKEPQYYEEPSMRYPQQYHDVYDQFVESPQMYDSQQEVFFNDHQSYPVVAQNGNRPVRTSSNVSQRHGIYTRRPGVEKAYQVVKGVTQDQSYDYLDSTKSLNRPNRNPSFNYQYEEGPYFEEPLYVPAKRQQVRKTRTQQNNNYQMTRSVPDLRFEGNFEPEVGETYFQDQRRYVNPPTYREVSTNQRAMRTTAPVVRKASHVETQRNPGRKKQRQQAPKKGTRTRGDGGSDSHRSEDEVWFGPGARNKLHYPRGKQTKRDDVRYVYDPRLQAEPMDSGSSIHNEWIESAMEEMTDNRLARRMLSPTGFTGEDEYEVVRHKKSDVIYHDPKVRKAKSLGNVAVIRLEDPSDNSASQQKTAADESPKYQIKFTASESKSTSDHKEGSRNASVKKKTLEKKQTTEDEEVAEINFGSQDQLRSENGTQKQTQITVVKETKVVKDTSSSAAPKVQKSETQTQASHSMLSAITPGDLASSKVLRRHDDAKTSSKTDGKGVTRRYEKKSTSKQQSAGGNSGDANTGGKGLQRSGSTKSLREAYNERRKSTKVADYDAIGLRPNIVPDYEESHEPANVKTMVPDYGALTRTLSNSSDASTQEKFDAYLTNMVADTKTILMEEMARTTDDRANSSNVVKPNATSNSKQKQSSTRSPPVFTAPPPPPMSKEVNMTPSGGSSSNKTVYREKPNANPDLSHLGGQEVENYPMENIRIRESIQSIHDLDMFLSSQYDTKSIDSTHSSNIQHFSFALDDHTTYL